MSAAEFASLLERACIQFPPEVTEAVIKVSCFLVCLLSVMVRVFIEPLRVQVFASPTRDFVPFREFLVGVHACLLFGDFLARVESLFGVCPQDREVEMEMLNSEV